MWLNGAIIFRVKELFSNLAQFWVVTNFWHGRFCLMGIIPANLNSEPQEKDHAGLAQPFGEDWYARQHSGETWELSRNYTWLRSYSFWWLSQDFNKEGWKSINLEVKFSTLKSVFFSANKHKGRPFIIPRFWPVYSDCVNSQIKLSILIFNRKFFLF